MNNLVTKFAKTAEESLQQTFGEVQTSFDKSVDYILFWLSYLAFRILALHGSDFP